jgi:chemotaxis protein MotB
VAKEKPIIVIKKITIAGAGHHGGSWKVALADFMTALMAFFLVMWLLNTSVETKKALSDYFSTPSVIEYNFQNFGAELTLEKLFLDLVNEPLKAFQSFMEPMDKTPNLLDMGSAKVVAAHLADQLKDYAKNVEVTPDGFDFDIPDNVLFQRGSSTPIASFVEIMDRIQTVTKGLEDAEVRLTSALFVQTVPGADANLANKVASERLELVSKKFQATLEHNTVTVNGNISVKEKKGEYDPQKLIGFIKINIRQKELKSNGQKPTKLSGVFGAKNVEMNVYDNFVQQLTTKRKKDAEKADRNSDQYSLNPKKKSAENSQTKE